MFREITYNGDVEGKGQAETTVSPDTSECAVYGLEDTGLQPGQSTLTAPQTVHLPREGIGSLRRHSGVSIGAREYPFTHQTAASDKRRGSNWSRKLSLFHPSAKEGLCSIEPGQNRSDISLESTDTGITIANEETSPPTPIQEILQAQEPGTYILTITEPESPPKSEEKTTLQVTVSPLRYASHVATADFLRDYTDQYPVPDIRAPLWIARFRYGWFTVYRRLFTIVFTANMVTIIILASRGSKTTYAQAALGVGSNILAAVLARHDNLINAVVSLIHLVPQSWPISFRKRIGKIYCHAGIHSGAGASAAAWYIYFTVLLGLQNIDGSQGIQIALYTTVGILLICLLAMVGLSHPWFRGQYHDIWELSHRFLGWTITSIIWAQVFLLSSTSKKSLGSALLRSPLFWMVTIVTLLLIYPWGIMRHRTFTATQLSSHALRLDFDYRRRVNRTGDNIRLSHFPLVENHGFATIPRPNGEKGFSCIISNAGDWTKDMITSEHRSNKIWVRGRLFLGIIEIPMLFSPLVIVATGSGIAPCLAFIQTHPEWPVRIVWSARFPEVTYGSELIETVLKADPNAIIIDTKETGRPNLVALMYAAYQVCSISIKQLHYRTNLLTST